MNANSNVNVHLRRMTFAAVVAALYAALTLVLAPISYGPVQFRISEVLCILPFFIPSSTWGLVVGCVVANLIGGNGILDVVFGSLATLVAGVATSLIPNKPLACLPPAVANGLIVGAVLAKVLTPDAFAASFPLFALEVFAGEAAVLFIIGLPLMYLLPRVNVFRKMVEDLGGKRGVSRIENKR